MEQLLHKGTDISDLAYLRVLQLAHLQASALVEDLKAHELPHMASRTPYEVTEFRRSLTGSAPATGSAPSAAISTMLETAMEELFVPYTEGQRYMERETKNLTTLYGNLLANFARYHVSRLPLVVVNLKLKFSLANSRKHRRENHPCSTEC